MARVNYAEAAMRFSHIDAEFVSCHFDLPNGNNYFTLEFYPWWEHPLFIEAKQTGAFWRFNDSDDGIRPVTVYPIGLRQFHISAHIQEIIDWKFVQEHPFLWQYEQTGRIYCDTPLSVETVLQITAEAVSKLDRAAELSDVAVYLNFDNVFRFGQRGLFCLGDFPRPVFYAVRSVLDEKQISYSIPLEPASVALPILFIMYTSEYIIADNFEVDIPEFVHRPEWFKPPAQ